MKKSALILWQKRLKMLCPFLLLFAIMPWKDALYNLIHWGLISWAIILITLFIGEALLVNWFSKVAFHQAFFNINKKE